MAEHFQTVVSSSQRQIRARICPQNQHVLLSIGHTCISLQKEEFLELTQVLQVAASHLIAQGNLPKNEQCH